MKQLAGAVFLGALLLFLVQPLLGRWILPWYGGSPTVWTTCMLFFQVFLLAGYLYAHRLGGALSRRRQAMAHLALLVVSLAFLPLTVPVPSPADPSHPVQGILLSLALGAGLPYLVISSSSPLLQRWYHLLRPTRSPYRLYALSNLGSLLGLLMYPFVLEPWLGLGHQALVWSIVYALYTALTAICAVDLLRGRDPGPPPAPPPLLPGGASGRRALALSERLLWFFLAACGSTALLATTNQMCQNVAVVPFLWVLPLALYLISFIICFDHDRWYDRRLWIPLLLVSCLAVAFLLKVTASADIRVQLAVYSITLLACCMVCHGELVRSRPPASHLTSFYLMVAAGGAAGGIFVSLVAPVVFDGFWEYPLCLVACYILAAVSVLSDLPRRTGRAWYLRHAAALWAAGAWALLFVFGSYIYKESASTLAMVRNFYGVLRVYEAYPQTEYWRRYLWHGDISHGCQFLHPAFRRMRTQYYSVDSGIALAIEQHPRRAEGLNIGVVGLGTGTLAAYGEEKDTLRFYEINPDVVDLARRYFTYLADTPATVHIVLGDARMSLERELSESGSRQFDVLVLDAFSGDAIPVHLFTREAFALYRRHLRPDGILAVHISNQHFDLEPLIRGLARGASLPAILIVNPPDEDNEIFTADWALLTTNEAFLTSPTVSAAVTPWLADKQEVVWTDDYSYLLGVLYD